MFRLDLGCSAWEYDDYYSENLEEHGKIYTLANRSGLYHGLQMQSDKI